MFLIIGHGLAGALLADALLRRGHAVRVVDRGVADGTSPASAVASGVLNPVTGKRLTRAWNLATFLPAALRTYRAFEEFFGSSLIQELDALWLHATPEDATFFATRAEQDAELFEAAVNPKPYDEFFHLREAPGRIHPVYSIDVLQTLSLLRQRLKTSGALLEERFNFADLQHHDHCIRYGDHQASHVIFCDGAAAVSNSYFQNLPWSPAAGEALILRIPHLPRTAVYKLGHSLSLAPWPGNQPPTSKDVGGMSGLKLTAEIVGNPLDEARAVTLPFGEGQGGDWWLGSNYLWDTLKPAPTAAFRQQCEARLKAWLKLPYEITDHRTGVRPATVDRKPFTGLHPLHPRIGIFNGLGAKGVLMAPYLAENLAAHLTDGTPLLPEADIARHRRALAR